MKQTMSLLVLLLCLGCDDGDLPIDTIDFDEIETIGSCDPIAVGSANVLFKINGDEALILELPNGLLKNEATTEEVISNVPGGAKVTYRLFSDNVDDGYFCDAVPPLQPVVIQDISAASGQVIVTTVPKDSIGFTHTIRLSNISFLLENGGRITDLRINDFGTVTTPL
ncbi:hypothetical protein [Maribacter sp. 2307ULW6-5]|uniref:hypothetical protein n=1 Tax=Maribacter sp. 2307ULW6-5 TaxID=3386275 RepID=UPI0039BCE0B2